MTAYYNEHDRNAAAWLRELIKAGLIAPGDVDERSIVEVRPGDLAGYTQCHFFAGIGVWSYALRLAGWDDSRRIWSGSCPCQPFSGAGGRAGFADERHLWPHWFQLIAQCRPDVIFGEQVASKDGLGWLDVVQADLEAADYAVGAVDLCAAGIGAPHIRQRLWFVADRTVADHDGAGRRVLGAPRLHADGQSGHDAAGCGAVGLLGHPSSSGGGWHPGAVPRAQGGADGLADAQRPGLQARPEGDVRGALGHDEGGLAGESGQRSVWSACDWIPCRDGKLRPVEPGTFPLVNGAAARVVRGSDTGASIDPKASSEARVMRLRGYGNAICAQAATAFISSYLDCEGER